MLLHLWSKYKGNYLHTLEFSHSNFQIWKTIWSLNFKLFIKYAKIAFTNQNSLHLSTNQMLCLYVCLSKEGYRGSWWLPNSLEGTEDSKVGSLMQGSKCWLLSPCGARDHHGQTNIFFPWRLPLYLRRPCGVIDQNWVSCRICPYYLWYFPRSYNHFQNFQIYKQKLYYKLMFSYWNLAFNYVD